MDLSSLKERIKAITPKMRDYHVKSCKSFLSKGLKENKNGTFPKGMVVLPTGSGKVKCPPVSATCGVPRAPLHSHGKANRNWNNSQFV